MIHTVVNLRLFFSLMHHALGLKCIHCKQPSPLQSSYHLCLELRWPAPNVNCTQNGDVAGSLVPGSLLAKVKLFLCSVCPRSRNSTIVGVYIQNWIDKKGHFLLLLVLSFQNVLLELSMRHASLHSVLWSWHLSDHTVYKRHHRGLWFL